MPRIFGTFLLTALPATILAAGMPEWLKDYPGAKAETSQSAGLVTSTYTVEAAPPAVIEHYRSVWGAVNLPFSANFNGTGTSIRAAATECDVLVQVVENGEGSHVRVSCAARNQAPGPESGWEVAARPSVPVQRRIERDPRTAAMLAQAQADHQARVARMEDFDRPVYPQPPRDPEGIPLQWPSWLVHMPGASRGLTVEAGKDQGGKRVLLSTFRTTRPMTEIHQFYEDLMNANGFRVGQSRIQTGQTLSGVQQNANGMVLGRQEPYGIGKGGMSTEARFYRSKLDEPIKVTLEVKLIQVYSNRR